MSRQRENERETPPDRHRPQHRRRPRGRSSLRPSPRQYNAPQYNAPQNNDQQYNSPAQDPPSRVARIAFAQGNVSLEPSGVSAFSQAELNYPLTAGDRVYVDNDSLAELQTSGLAVRMGNGADLTLSSLTDGVAQFGLAQGSIRLRTRDLSAPPDLNGNPQQGLVEIDTPNGAILVKSPGDIRIDSYPQDDSTVVIVSSGSVEVTGANLDQLIGPNQAMRFVGSPVAIQRVSPLPPDSLDQIDQQREAAFNASLSLRDNYVSPDMIGAADLDQYGDWSPSPDYGEVWFPRTVAFGWAPYQNGHWAWVAPWGWTWIEAEPWGFAPFHYGRWSNIDGRWGWIPGPPPTVWGRPIRPVYSPALVVFVGGGVGITAWFPLGPGEPYQPWYHASPAYVNRVNVTNIYSRNAAQLRATYSNRTSVAFNVNVNLNYANRPAATTAIAQRDFAAGRSATAAPLRLTPAAREQLTQAPVLPHPLVTPTAAMAAPQAPARALPPNPTRPEVTNRPGFVRSGTPASQPPATQPATQPVTQPPAQPTQPARGNFPQQRDVRPVTPAIQATPEPAPVTAMPTPARPAPPSGATPRTATPGAPVPHVEAPAAPRPADQPRPLVNRTPPQTPQPSFADQQREIQRVDPGRPLGPQQVDNVRAGRPAGPPSQPEPSHTAPPPASHPAPPPPAKTPPAKKPPQ